MDRLRTRHIRALRIFCLILLALVCLPATERHGLVSPVSAATWPSGFVETRIANAVNGPTALDVAPDGRVFFTQQSGEVLIIKNGALLPTPFLTLSNIDWSGERGLLGITLDPNFATNQYVYLYYAARTPVSHNRVSRFTASGDSVLAGSEVVLIDLPPINTAIWHMGGGIHFGGDGKLYIAVGDHQDPNAAQLLTSPFGKILRINPDGGIPSDNPFFSQTTGVNQAIWALGLRNPYTFNVQPGTGRIYINDVGNASWEEINEGSPGANFGWPTTEGYTSDPRFKTPVYAYPHSEGCSITGGTFYNPVSTQFPAAYVGKYIFPDFCQGWVRTVDPASKTVAPFGTGISWAIDMDVGVDGSLYYLARGTGPGPNTNGFGSVWKVQYTGTQTPQITAQPANQTAFVGDTASFSVSALGATSIQWQKNGVNIAGATSATYTTPATSLADNGSTYRAVVSNSFGSTTSLAAVLTVTNNQLPVPSISAPATGTTYRAGDSFTFSGSASDPEDGPLPASAFTWQVDFLHETHSHPFMSPIGGVTSGSFTTMNSGEAATNVGYRIYLSVRDSAGRVASTYRDIRPQVSSFTITSSPPGLQVSLDGKPQSAPVTVSSVIGMRRLLGALSPQITGGTVYEFSSWSNGGAASQTITTPASASTFTANYMPSATAHLARWSLNEGSGTIAGDATGHGFSGTLINGPLWTTGQSGGALSLDGVDDHVAANAHVVNTAQNFTVSAWVQLNRNNGFFTAVSQDGAAISGFFLQFLQGEGRFAFTIPAADSTSAGGVRAIAPAPPTLGAWYHLVGMSDASNNLIKLYVNGAPVSVMQNNAHWDATGATMIGRGKFGGPADFWPGKIDEVNLYRWALSDQEIAALYSGSLVGRWGLNETAGSVAADSSGNGNSMTLTNGPIWAAGRQGNGLTLDGVDDHAVSSRALVDTSSSYSVGAWVQLSRTNGWFTAVGQDGALMSGFFLQYSQADGRFAFSLPESDSGDGRVSRALAGSAPAINTWYHLVGVRDAINGQIKLYVNGALASTQAYNATWNAQGVTTIGRARAGGNPVDYWPGKIDEVVLYSRALSAQEVQALYSGSNGTGTGLRGDYYTGMNFETYRLTRTDATLNMNWGSGSPDPLLPVDGFSARWTGQIQPRYAETYTFYITSDNGRRVWINNQLVVDKWIDDWDVPYTGQIALSAGQKYDIKVEYFENFGGANIKLEWSSASQAREVVPQSQLYPPPTTPTPTATRTATRTNTITGPTNTRTRTNTTSGATATRTRTNTTSGATATRTRTNTSAPPTATRTRTNTTASGNPAWAPNTAYAVGARVSYGGLNYECIQAHTSQVGWEPSNVPALWRQI